MKNNIAGSRDIELKLSSKIERKIFKGESWERKASKTRSKLEEAQKVRFNRMNRDHSIHPQSLKRASDAKSPIPFSNNKYLK